MLPEVKQEVYIQSYKHDGSLHRTWDKGYVLEADENQFVLVTNKTWVVESNGKRWYTREPAVCFFDCHRWYNVIAMIRNDNIYYYCNLASPSIYDGEAVKYIDYDVDYKVYDDLVLTMDLDEYSLHKRTMHYSEDIEKIIKFEMQRITSDIKNKHAPFNKEYVEKYFEMYLQDLESTHIEG